MQRVNNNQYFYLRALHVNLPSSLSFLPCLQGSCARYTHYATIKSSTDALNSVPDYQYWLMLLFFRSTPLPHRCYNVFSFCVNHFACKTYQSVTFILMSIISRCHLCIFFSSTCRRSACFVLSSQEPSLYCVC
jgi:hypothetical protein